MTFSDVRFEDATNTVGIGLRLHPLDVGFDLRAEGVEAAVPEGAELRASYARRNGDRYVMSGLREAVIKALRRQGYKLVA